VQLLFPPPKGNQMVQEVYMVYYMRFVPSYMLKGMRIYNTCEGLVATL
jgi:hypothetical protein